MSVSIGIASAIGFIVPNVQGAYISNPGYSATDPHEVGTVTVGSRTFNVLLNMAFGDREPIVMEGSSVIARPYFTYGGHAFVGYYATYDESNDEGHLYFVDVDTPSSSVDGSVDIYAQNGRDYPYAAVQICTFTSDDFVEDRDWDDTPSEDENDPTNVSPQGGEYAERGLFADTDNIALTELPNPDATMNMSFSSFVTCFLLDSTSLQGLGTALFNASFWGNLKSKFEGLSDPLSMILACHQIPLAVSGTQGQFQIGGVVPDNNGTPVPATRTATRYVKLSMGSVNLKEIFGSEKDYSNVSIQIYLPYVGMRDIDPDLAVGNALTLVCYVDIWTGDVLYLLHVSNATRSKKYFTSETVPYRWSGNCAKSVPLGRVDNSRMIMNMVTTVASVGAGLATMGMGSVGAIGGGATTTATGAETASKASNVASIKEGAKQVGGAVTEAVTSSKLTPIVQSSGGIAGSVGHMDLQSAYIIVKRGVPKYPNDWRTQFGAPNYQTLPVASLSGYTKFSTIHLENMGVAVAEEISELERLITTEGIIL